VPRFLRWAVRIRKQLATSDGCAGYSLDAHLLRNTFYTLSAWQDRDAMNRFVQSGRHAAMLADMGGRLGQSTFVESSTQAQVWPPVEAGSVSGRTAGLTMVRHSRQPGGLVAAVVAWAAPQHAPIGRVC
jgi:quinol monooxygenase YgiN